MITANEVGDVLVTPFNGLDALVWSHGHVVWSRAWVGNRLPITVVDTLVHAHANQMAARISNVIGGVMMIHVAYGSGMVMVHLGVETVSMMMAPVDRSC